MQLTRTSVESTYLIYAISFFDFANSAIYIDVTTWLRNEIPMSKSISLNYNI